MVEMTMDGLRRLDGNEIVNMMAIFGLIAVALVSLAINNSNIASVAVGGIAGFIGQKILNDAQSGGTTPIVDTPAQDLQNTQDNKNTQDSQDNQNTVIVPAPIQNSVITQTPDPITAPVPSSSPDIDPNMIDDDDTA